MLENNFRAHRFKTVGGGEEIKKEKKKKKERERERVKFDDNTHYIYIYITISIPGVLNFLAPQSYRPKSIICVCVCVRWRRRSTGASLGRSANPPHDMIRKFVWIISRRAGREFIICSFPRRRRRRSSPFVKRWNVRFVRRRLRCIITRLGKRKSRFSLSERTKSAERFNVHPANRFGDCPFIIMLVYYYVRKPPPPPPPPRRRRRYTSGNRNVRRANGSRCHSVVHLSECPTYSAVLTEECRKFPSSNFEKNYIFNPSGFW